MLGLPYPSPAIRMAHCWHHHPRPMLKMIIVSDLCGSYCTCACCGLQILVTPAGIKRVSCSWSTEGLRFCVVTLVNYTITQNQTTSFKLLTSRNSMWKVQTGVSQVADTLWKFWHDSSGTAPTSATWSTSDQLASNLTQTQLMSRWMYAKKISGVPDPAQWSGEHATWEGSGSAQLKHVQQQHPTTTVTILKRRSSLSLLPTINRFHPYEPLLIIK